MLIALLDDRRRDAPVQLGEEPRQPVRAELAWERQSAAYLDVMRSLTKQTLPHAASQAPTAHESTQLHEGHHIR